MKYIFLVLLLVFVFVNNRNNTKKYPTVGAAIAKEFGRIQRAKTKYVVVITNIQQKELTYVEMCLDDNTGLELFGCVEFALTSTHDADYKIGQRIQL